MHIDANSAYLSWTAVNLLQNGYGTDIREIPSAIAGDPNNRHGIILAKSIPAKKYGITTGESLFEARRKCPELQVFPPEFDLYMKCSQEMFNILKEYSPLVQRYSVDECFLDYTLSERKFGDPVKTAYEIKDRIKNELGYTVNVGVSCNKLLAKMGSELKKPDRVHTLFPEEIEEKMWPLPVEELFMVGRATAKKLKKMNINTIGDLARTDVIYLKSLLKSHGELVWNYANGIDPSPVTVNDEIDQKGIGNSMTLKYDVTDRKEAKMFLLSLSERVGMRLRKHGFKAGLVSVTVKSSGFERYSHQMKLYTYTDSTTEIYKYACRLFDQCWKGEPIRLLGVSVTNFKNPDEPEQISMFGEEKKEKEQALDKAIDAIRERYGQGAIIRGAFANHQNVKPIEGGVNDGNYIMMGGHEE
ncbi:MAG: DNA polymerase IV [Firmicutes bacterium]|nr:DNA polymerase IV [Bacillota bacterium]